MPIPAAPLMPVTVYSPAEDPWERCVQKYAAFLMAQNVQRNYIVNVTTCGDLQSHQPQNQRETDDDGQ